MNYTIYDITGNMVDSYSEEREALGALEGIVGCDPEAAHEYALITEDDYGMPVGKAIIGSDIIQDDYALAKEVMMAEPRQIAS